MRHVLLTGGWAHDFEAHAPTLVEVIESKRSMSTEMCATVDELATALAEPADLLTVYACWFRMLDDRYNAEQRAGFATETPAPVRDAISDHVRAGRPVLAVHTATICFDDWPEWQQLIGGGWDWARSHHPEPGPMRVDYEPVAADLFGAVESFEVIDERYTDLAVHAASRVVATSALPLEHARQPAAWCREHASGSRVFTSTLGHDSTSLRAPGHVSLLAGAVRWLLKGGE